MATTARIAVVEDALYDRLVALAATVGNALNDRGGTSTEAVPISPAHPGELLQRDHVWIGASIVEAQTQDVTGNNPNIGKIEDTPCPVVFRATDPDYPTARSRALAYAGALENDVRADPHLGVGSAQVFDSEVASIEKDAWMSEDGWVVALRVTVTARSWLG